MEYRKLQDLTKLPNNPRVIRDAQFKTLCDSIRDNREYFEARPLILSNRTGELVIIAGNQRYEAAKFLKLEEVPTYLIEGLTVEREREIIIRDNVTNGEFDWDALANEWSDLPLAEWGVDLPEDWLTQPDGEEYSRNIKAPIYEPKGTKPDVRELCDETRTKELLRDIDAADLPEDEKQFLRIAARRHTVLNYKRIAEYYAHAEAEVQKLMEDSALVIIDFGRAIELGYVRLSEETAHQYEKDYPDG
jgi:hypothetical protein